MTPASLQGRVLSTNGLIGQLTHPLGLLIVGLASDVMSPSALFFWSGISVGLGAFFWLLSPTLQSIDAASAAEDEFDAGRLEHA